MQINNSKSFQMDNPFLFGKTASAEDKRAAKGHMFQRDADHVMNLALKTEKSFNAGMDGIRKKLQEIGEDSAEAAKNINKYKEFIQNSKEYYQVADDSQEQKDLELMIKGSSGGELTAEEKERLSQMGEKTEYQKEALSYQMSINYNQERLKRNQDIITNGNRSIRLSTAYYEAEHVMIKAADKKEDILETGSKEMIGLLTEDAKDQVDEKTDEIKDDAEEKAEAKAEEEKRLEAAKENKSPIEQQAEINRENVENVADAVIDQGSASDKVQIEVNDIKVKLTDDELKGLVVDEHL